MPVRFAEEPPDFDRRVRQFGLLAIAERTGQEPPFPRKRGKKLEKLAERAEDIPADKFPKHWTRVLSEMKVAYENRCAYLAMRIDAATGRGTVDHIIPKSFDWTKVYEWSNMCLCCALVNSLKGDALDWVDPFAIDDRWFALKLNSCFVTRGDLAPEQAHGRIEATLRGLNHKDCVDQRVEYVERYRLGSGKGGIDLAFLEVYAPFIACELCRQGKLERDEHLTPCGIAEFVRAIKKNACPRPPCKRPVPHSLQHHRIFPTL